MIETLPMPNIREEDISRFWGNVSLKADIDKCWEWTGETGKRGYGKLWFKIDGKERYISSSRLSYYLNYNTDPVGKIVCHRCDNKTCCNPFHLFLGTNKDNTIDMMKKGRGGGQFKNGENHSRAIITNEIAQKIRQEHSLGERQGALAVKYGIWQSEVSRIVNYKKWKNI